VKALFRAQELDLRVMEFGRLLIDTDELASESVFQYSVPWVQLACGLLGATNENQVSLIQSEDSDEAAEVLDAVWDGLEVFLSLPADLTGYSTIDLCRVRGVPMVRFHDSGLSALVVRTDDIEEMAP
jgi:hypothetical protein